MLPKPSLNRTARDAVRELRTDHGIEPTLDDILWLHELGKRVENPIAGERLNLMGVPAKAGNAYLWPFTVMGANWYNNLACSWFEQSPHVLFYCLAFALAHGRGRAIPEPAGRGWCERMLRGLLEVKTCCTLDDLIDRDTAYRVVMRWARTLQCRREELDAAIDSVLPAADKAEAEADKEQESGPPPVDMEQIARELAVLTGTDPDYWRKQCQSHVADAYIRANAIERARRGEGSAPIKSAQDLAIQDLREAIKAIIEAHKQEGGEAENISA